MENEKLNKKTDFVYSTRINELIQSSRVDANNISDGYHTFGELYHHRCLLYIAFLQQCQSGHSYSQKKQIWKSNNYSDGTPVEEGFFILGFGLKDGDVITYHLPSEFYPLCGFAVARSKSFFDGHTSVDVLSRLTQFIVNKA